MMVRVKARKTSKGLFFQKKKFEVKQQKKSPFFLYSSCPPPQKIDPVIVKNLSQILSENF
jgi:hypothetical protein